MWKWNRRSALIRPVCYRISMPACCSVPPAASHSHGPLLPHPTLLSNRVPNFFTFILIPYFSDKTGNFKVLIVFFLYLEDRFPVYFGAACVFHSSCSIFFFSEFCYLKPPSGPHCKKQARSGSKFLCTAILTVQCMLDAPLHSVFLTPFA
jgi:hypothetical protein